MALFHFHVTQVKRSAGQSVVAQAAYCAGEKLYSERYGEVSDYTHKGGVVCADIFLPAHAPPEYKDRAVLWNAVERAERGKKAQLAYSFDIALQNELTLDENVVLARQFVVEQLVSKGMIADLAVHDPDKENPNPHIHILCPIRPLDEAGGWGQKQRRVYRLDEHGNRIMGKDGKPLFDAVPTTDWGAPETLEHWREQWASMVNAKFAEKGLARRIDHRSYERQGVDVVPTVHEGPAVRKMEAKGVRTEKGELNRWIKSSNSLMAKLRKKITDLLSWLGEVKEELSRPQSPSLADLLGAYYETRNGGAWSQKAKVNNLKQFAKTVNYLTERGLITADDLERHVAAMYSKISTLQEAMKSKSNRKKELRELLDLVQQYQEGKPVFDELNAIKWKGRRQKFIQEHDNDLRHFFAVRRRLKNLLGPAGKIEADVWKDELRQLQDDYDTDYAEYKSMKDELKELWPIKRAVDEAIKKQDRTPSQHLNRGQGR